MSVNMVTLGGDEVDGTCSEVIRRNREDRRNLFTCENDSSPDSSYETDEEGHLSDSSSMGKATPETNRKFWKSKKSKTTNPAVALVTSLTHMNLQDHDRTPTNAEYPGAEYLCGEFSSSSRSSSMSSLDNTGYLPLTVKLRAETSRANDCQMRLGQPIDTVPKTLKPVYNIKFDGYDDDQDETTHEMVDISGKVQDTYADVRFYMKGPPTPEESPREPTPDEREPTPEKEPSEREPEEEEGSRNDEVDAGQEASSDDDKYNYRLARVELVNDTRVVAIHETDVNLTKEDGKNVFSIQWKVTLKEDKSYILCDTVEHTQKIDDLILAVTSKGVRMVKMNEHPEDFQNPNTKIAIWSVRKELQCHKNTL